MRRILILAAVFLLASPVSRAQDTGDEINSHIIRKIDMMRAKPFFENNLLGAPEPTPNQSLFDVKHYTIDIAINDSTQYIEGTVTIILESLLEGLASIDINADTILSVGYVGLSGTGAVPFSREGDVLTADLSTPLYAGEEASIEVQFEGYAASAINPGIFFREYDGMIVIFSLSEPWSSRSWWPCKDYPDDKATFDLNFSVPSYMTAASNGEYLGYTEETRWGRPYRRYSWRENYEMSTYLASISATDYTVLTEYWEYSPGDSMIITNYVPPGRLWQAEEDLNIAVPALDFFSSIYGLYPFVEEKYGVSLVNIGGGMEHQTLTSYGIYFVRGDHYYDWIYIHELSHQWFGDLITCENWEDIWLNEGWASYSEALWEEHLGGEQALRSYMQGKDTEESWNGPVLRDPFNTNPNYYFDLVVYHKAAWILHMFRHIAGDSVFFDMAKGYASDPRFRFSTANTSQFVSVCEDYYGAPLDWFFDPWLTREDRPSYEWSWDCYPAGGDTVVSISVTQAPGDAYVMPVDFRIETRRGNIDTILWVDEAAESFLISAGAMVTSVELDPGGWILCDKSSVVTDAVIPAPTYLSQNYPNPFNPSTTIPFGIAEPGHVRISLFDAGGRHVKTLADRSYPAGSFDAKWDGTDKSGRKVSSGVFFYKMTARGKVFTRKMILLR